MATKTEKRSAKKTKIFAVIGAILVGLTIVLGYQLFSTTKKLSSTEEELGFNKEVIEELRKQLADAQPEEPGIIIEPEPVITTSTVSEQLNAIQELVTAEYLYTNADRYENNNKIKVVKWEVSVPFSQKYFTIAYDGRIKAGMDLSKAEIEVEETSRTITIALPKSTITSHETFEDTLVVLNEADGLFNKITIENYNDFIKGQKAKMEDKAIKERGLLTEADTKAKAAIRNILNLLPGIDTYTIQFEDLT